MIQYKSEDEMAAMKKSCRLAARVLDYIAPFVKPDVSTNELNDLCHEFILRHGAVPSPLNYGKTSNRPSFPKSICTSVNHCVCHGIPDDYRLKEGDIVNLDITTYIDGYHGDTSKTFLVGKCSRSIRDLVSSTEAALWKGIEAVHPDAYIGDIGAAIQDYLEPLGYSIVREYTGHGIGRKFHEDPYVPHVGKRGTGPKIKPGMVFTIEPMVNMGTADVVLHSDGWTVLTADKKPSAQFEHTVAVFKDRVEVLTVSETFDRDPVVWRAK